MFPSFFLIWHKVFNASHTPGAASVGIVVIAVISLLVSFCGFTVLNW